MVDVPVHDHFGVDAGSSPSADTPCRTRRARPQRYSLCAGCLRRGFPQGSRRTTAPLSSPGWSPPCTSRGWQCPASCRDDRSTPDLLTSRHRPLPTGLVAPSNATGGSHGEYSRFPTVVPTHNIDGSHTSKYSCQYVRVKERALMERSSPCFT